MTLLMVGVALFTLLQLFPVVLPDARNNLITSLGEKPYMALFALSVLGSFALIIFGWRGAEVSQYYFPSAGLRHPAMLLVVIAFVFIVSSHFRRTRIRKFVRHPQLTAIAIWAFAHLLANGDSRSVVLFGGFLIWSVLSIILINRRDGEWEKPTEFMPAWREIFIPLAAVIVSGIIVKFHYYIAGVPLMPTS